MLSMKQQIRLVFNNLDLSVIIQPIYVCNNPDRFSIGIFHARLKITNVYWVYRFTRPSDLNIKNIDNNNTIQHGKGTSNQKDKVTPSKSFALAKPSLSVEWVVAYRVIRVLK